MSWTGRMHFVGIGGAGMSAIAKVLVERGVSVSGSDLKASRVTDALAELGAKISVGHDPVNVEGASTVIVSAAIADSNPELLRARELGLEVIARGEALARLLDGTRSIVVAGTHGKTTTTSMIVSILRSTGRDPTYLVGGGLNDAGTNAALGRDDLAVAESDESDGSFLLLSPTVAVVTNIEIDHVDRWGSIDELRAAFVQFVDRVEASGTLVAPSGDEITGAAGDRVVITFGPGGDLRAEKRDAFGRGTRFHLVAPEGSVEVGLQVPGEHNVTDALAAAGAARAIGLSLEEIATGLESFAGVERRFEVVGESGGVTLVDDYAHHPAEIRATLAAANEGQWARIHAIFQPHRYSRTRALWREFGSSFAGADRIVVTDVYGAGEPAIPGVTGKLIADAVAETLPGRAVAYLPHRRDIAPYVAHAARAGDIVLTMGAGDITSLGPELLERFGRDA